MRDVLARAGWAVAFLWAGWLAGAGTAAPDFWMLAAPPVAAVAIIDGIAHRRAAR